MRISDWSSDVCSSDLPGHRDEEQRRQRDEVDEAVEGLAALLAEDGEVSGSIACGHDRSEEHTSELQSLMRISYAVFCLKKKTIQTTDIHRTANQKLREPNTTPLPTHTHTQHMPRT